MKKLFSFSNVLKTLSVLVATSSISCGVDREQVTNVEELQQQSKEQILYAPSSVITITSSANAYLYSVEEIEDVFYDLYPSYEQYSNSLSIAKVYSENYLPYMEALYLSICTTEEAEEWFDSSFEVPEVWMYLINLPNSQGYALLNADKRTASPLVMFQKECWLNPEVVNDFSDLTEALCYYVTAGSNSIWLSLDTLYRDFAYRTFGWPFPYNTIDFITSWHDDMTSLHVDPNNGGGGNNYTVTYSKTAYVPYHCNSNGIYKWTDSIPGAEFGYPWTGTIPLAIIKTLAYKQFIGHIGDIQNVNMCLYINLMNPVEPYSLIWEMGHEVLNSSYYSDYTETDKDDAWDYVADNYYVLTNQSNIFNSFVNTALYNDDVVIYQIKDPYHNVYEWNIIDGITTITKTFSPGSEVKITYYYDVDNHSGHLSTKRIYKGELMEIH